MISASNNAVKRPFGSAHGTAICFTPRTGHGTRDRVGDQNRAILTRIQVSPATRPRVVAGASFAARGAMQRLAGMLELHANLVLLAIQRHVRHTPERGDTRNLRVKLGVSHRPGLPPVTQLRPGHTRPQQTRIRGPGPSGGRRRPGAGAEPRSVYPHESSEGPPRVGRRCECMTALRRRPCIWRRSGGIDT